MLPTLSLFDRDFPLYGICVFCGSIALLITVHLRGKAARLPFIDTIWFGYASFLGLLIGSRLLGLISELPQLAGNISLQTLTAHFISGPIVFYGGLLGALGGGFVYAKLRKLNVQSYFNMFVPSYPLFHVFGRLGCFFGGCCYGIECSWGVHFVTDPDVKRLPVQLFEAAFELIVFFVLIIIDKKKKNSINLTKVYLAMYAPFRFAVEFLRGDEIRGFFGWFSTSQWVSVFIMIILLCITLKSSERHSANMY